VKEYVLHTRFKHELIIVYVLKHKTSLLLYLLGNSGFYLRLVVRFSAQLAYWWYRNIRCSYKL